MKKNGLYILIALLFLFGGIGVQRVVSFSRSMLTSRASGYCVGAIESTENNELAELATQEKSLHFCDECFCYARFCVELAELVAGGSVVVSSPFFKPFLPKLPFVSQGGGVVQVH